MSELTTIFPASTVDRRQFLKVTGGFLLAFSLTSIGRRALATGATTTDLSAFIRIGSDESITILLGGGEMGQGIYSGLAQGAAEELMVDWTLVKVEPVAASQSWLTGGSTGVMRHLSSMRVAGATAREMLIAAAAQTWGVAPSSCQAVKGTVVNTLSNASFTYGQLANLAATMPVPANPPLVPDNALKVIGQIVQRPDIPAKTNGSAIFGIDVTLPGMVFAAVKHCPTLGGTVSGTVAVPSGALAAVPLGNAVAVVAGTTWQAMRSAEQLNVNWSIPPSSSDIDSTVIQAQAQSLMASGPVIVAETAGDTVAGLAGAATTVDVTYSLPYLAHACMEVLNCTVNLTSTTCDIWVPTQAPNTVLSTAVSLTGLTADQITVHPTFLGGGLGRKFEVDYVIQAITVAQAIGQPVKLTWSREQDMGNDKYRPMALSRIQAGADAAGNIVAWSNRIVSPSILGQRGWIPPAANDSQATDGATALVYGFGSRLVEYVKHPAAVPLGFWRSVGHSINAFAVESALDELALALNIDPLQFRRNLLSASSDPLAARSLAVLNQAASLGNWGTATLPAGHAQGLAFSVGFGSIVAQVVEISQPAAGSFKIHNVACAIDCGMAVNPDSVEAQMQGAIHHGLSSSLWGQVTFKAGAASARNFSNYRMMVLGESPTISVDIIQSGAPLGGVGEPGVPGIAPAVANAYARLTGTRLRSLPFFPGATMSDG
jgi:isoquinoline 1-oxidoreductase beta subunit